jgi:nitrite reductase/ring-hydroxylating ferredoxin subunit
MTLTSDDMNTDLNEFTKLCRVDSLVEKRGKKFVVGEVEVAVFKVGENVYALNNICPHQHTSIISEGVVEKGCVLCPAHGWEFQLKNGKLKYGGGGVDSYEVKIVDDFVYAKVFEKKLNW